LQISWKRIFALVVLIGSLPLGGCDWSDTDCEDACQKMKNCEMLLDIKECKVSCEHQILDCSEQIDCVLRSDCDAVEGCLRYYPCKLHSWDDDDEW